MLERKRRLTKNRYFQYIYKKGDRANSENVYLVFLKTKIRPSKFGFVVTNKVGKAVQRNLVKRRLRAIVQELLPEINQSYNYVLVAKQGIVTQNFEDLSNEVRKLFQKAGFLV